MRVHLFSRGSSNIKKEIKKKRCLPALITAFGEALALVSVQPDKINALNKI